MLCLEKLDGLGRLWRGIAQRDHQRCGAGRARHRRVRDSGVGEDLSLSDAPAQLDLAMREKRRHLHPLKLVSLAPIQRALVRCVAN